MSGSVKPSSPAASPQSPVMVWKKIEFGRWNCCCRSHFARRHRLAAGDAGQVGDHAFHLVEAVGLQIGRAASGIWSVQLMPRLPARKKPPISRATTRAVDWRVQLPSRARPDRARGRARRRAGGSAVELGPRRTRDGPARSGSGRHRPAPRSRRRSRWRAAAAPGGGSRHLVLVPGVQATALALPVVGRPADRPAAGELLDLAAKRLGDDLVAEADADQRPRRRRGSRGSAPRAAR